MISRIYLAGLGRVALALLFILGGINKVLHQEAAKSQMLDAGLPWVDGLLFLVIALELGGGLLLAIGNRLAPLAAIALALFTLGTNALFHDFWNQSEPMASLQLSLFFKNVAIAGALVLAAAVTPLGGEG